MKHDYIRDGDIELTRACTTAELPAGRSRLVFFDDERQVALFNVAGTLYAVSNICPHQHEPVIFEGMVEDCTVTCPLHGNAYRLDTGEGIEGGARLKRYEVRIIDENVYVEIPREEQPKWMQGL
ncbi:MAG: nitrite reductase (NAD(P)H) small subunit [bacterium]|nr:nitrite reductase (NAD(P)H) small subunit [Candidatus Kapabacteria bacterium]